MEDGKWPLKYLDFAYSGLFVCNEPQNGWTDRAHILCGMWHKGLWIKEISKISIQENLITNIKLK